MKYFYHGLMKFFRRIDFRFVVLILIIQGIGLITLYSATHGAYSSNKFLFNRQIIWLCSGWLIFFILYSIDYSFLKKITWPLYFIHIALLVFTLFFGEESQNVKRWIHLGFFNYQPSEFLKFVLVLLIAHKLSFQEFKKTLPVKQLIEYGILIVPPVILVALQPDLGTAGISVVLLSTLILFNGISKKSFIWILTIFCVSAPLTWKLVLKPYQKSRITSFMHPEKDPKGTGYNIIQSKIAIGSGGLSGKGFSKGTQHQLQFLPERHTDFIFSVLSEEYGFLGSLGTLMLFLLLIFLTLSYAAQARNRFGCYLCLGSGMFLFWHILLNLAMTMGLFPITGSPLPLMSYGGSHALTTMAFLGLAASVNKRKDLF